MIRAVQLLLPLTIGLAFIGAAIDGRPIRYVVDAREDWREQTFGRRASTQGQEDKLVAWRATFIFAGAVLCLLAAGAVAQAT